MEFSRPEDWSGLPRTPPGDLPNPAIKLGSPALQVDSLPAEPPGKPLKSRNSACSMAICLQFLTNKAQQVCWDNILTALGEELKRSSPLSVSLSLSLDFPGTYSSYYICF